jgi:hypothetical protein
LAQRFKVIGANIKAQDLKEEHFNKASDELNQSFVRMYTQWGDEVARSVKDNDYPDPQVLTDTLNGLQDEIAATQATPQAKVFYDELAQGIAAIISGSSENPKKYSLALGAVIERTKNEFITSTAGRAATKALQPRATAEGN